MVAPWASDRARLDGRVCPLDNLASTSRDVRKIRALSTARSTARAGASSIHFSTRSRAGRRDVLLVPRLRFGA